MHRSLPCRMWVDYGMLHELFKQTTHAVAGAKGDWTAAPIFTLNFLCNASKARLRIQVGGHVAQKLQKWLKLCNGVLLCLGHMYFIVINSV